MSDLRSACIEALARSLQEANLEGGFTWQSVTRQIVGDSLEKRKLVAKLVQLVREDERRKASQ